MKKSIYYLFFMALVSLASCVAVPVRTAGNSGKIPPGQAKKETGTQSAKPYAPGQTKKSHGNPSAPGQQKKKK